MLRGDRRYPEGVPDSQRDDDPKTLRSKCISCGRNCGKTPSRAGEGAVGGSTHGTVKDSDSQGRSTSDRAREWGPNPPTSHGLTKDMSTQAPARRDWFPWLTGAAIALVFTAIAIAPPSEDAKRVPKVSGLAASLMLADASTPLVITFGVRGCHMCTAAVKILRGIAKASPGVRFAEVDLDEADRLRDDYGVAGAPYQLVFVEGRLAYRTGSLEDVAELRRALGR